jgi:hypothetical protein
MAQLGQLSFHVSFTVARKLSDGGSTSGPCHHATGACKAAQMSNLTVSNSAKNPIATQVSLLVDLQLATKVVSWLEMSLAASVIQRDFIGRCTPLHQCSHHFCTFTSQSSEGVSVRQLGIN